MKLLFDKNLSFKLVDQLAAEFPGSAHVVSVGLLGAQDAAIWQYARDHGFVIVSKDTDFRERSYLDGYPPKVVWLDVGNIGTATVAEILRLQRGRLEAFVAAEESSLLVLSRLARAD